MRLLPGTVDEVVIPRFFSPSRFSELYGCRLRVLVQGNEGCLAPPARTVFGLVLHHLRREAFSGRSRCGSSDGDSVSECFAEMMRQLDRQLTERESTAGLVPIKEALGWHAVSSGLTRLRRWIEPLRSGGRGGSVRPLPDIIGSGLGDEVHSSRVLETGPESWIVSPKWRLRGRADDVRELRGVALKITDFKSGRLIDREGALRRDVELQVRLYALAAQESTDLPIRLFVEGDHRYEVSWRNEDRDATISQVHNCLDALPTGMRVRALELANPGPQCAGCLIRPRCERYLTSAPAMWCDESLAGRLPFDTWGRVVAIHRFQGVRNLEIEDANGDLVLVYGLETPTEDSSLRVGDQIYLFELETSEQRIAHGSPVRPRNFHVIPVDGGFRLRKARTAAAFVGTG